MAGVADVVREQLEQAETLRLREYVLRTRGAALTIEQPDRVTMTAGIDIIEQPNFLRFIALTERTGTGAPPFSIVFDSFLVQRVTRQKNATFDVRYTVGAPVVDVFKDGVELLSVNATLPDTAPFYTIGGRPDAVQVAQAQQDLNLAGNNPGAAASAARRLAGALNVNVITGYVGESLEALKAVYNRYFRASSAVGAEQGIIGIVEFWSKGRVDRGYMVKLALERTSAQLDHAEITFDFFVSRSVFKNIRKPEVVI